MGLTPLDGLIAELVAGTIDPALLVFLSRVGGFIPSMRLILNEQAVWSSRSVWPFDSRDIEDELLTLAIGLPACTYCSYYHYVSAHYGMAQAMHGFDTMASLLALVGTLMRCVLALSRLGGWASRLMRENKVRSAIR